MRIWCAIIALVLGLGGVAWAQLGENARRCFTPDSPPELRVQYCTRVIQAGELPRENLAYAYFARGAAYNDKKDYELAIQDFTEAIRIRLKAKDMPAAFFARGGAYKDKKDYDRAIQDYTEAIRLDPTQVDFFMCRGIAYHHKGDYDQAIQDYTEWLRLKPGDASAFLQRGLAHHSKGDDNRAIQDFTEATRVTSKEAAWGYRNRGTIRFEQGQLQDAGRDLAKAIEIDPTDHHAALYLYLVQTRAGQDARGNLAKTAQRLDLREWPGPVVSMYLGKSTAEAVFKAASANPDPEERRKQQCHAAYFIGHHLLAQGAKADAVKQLQWVASACAATPFDFSGAKAELRRLGN